MSSGSDGFLPSDRAVLNWIRTAVTSVLSYERHDNKVHSAQFKVITRRNINSGKVVPMAVMLINDMISNIPMEFDNLAGTPVAPPASGTVVLSITDGTGAVSPLGTAAMGADGKSVDVTPTQPGDTTGAALTLNFEDTAPGADLKASLGFVFTADQAAASVHFVTTGITTRALGTP